MEISGIEQAMSSLFFAILLVLVVFFVALYAGYFRLPSLKHSSPITLRQTIGIFVLYLLLAFFILPLINLGLVQKLKQANLLGKWVGWLQIGSLLFAFLCLLLYCFLISSQARAYIFWGEQRPSLKLILKSLVMGMVSWVISYPFVFLAGIITSLISLAIWHEAKMDQVAVRQLKTTMDRPVLFGMMIFFVVILVPFMEELLFRGFLQSFLKRHLGRLSGILVTATVFAFVHYAPSQGTGNFQLIVSLFVLSCFLGFIYEKERTLFAPIALHSTFNGFSVLLIFLGHH